MFFSSVIPEVSQVEFSVFLCRKQLFHCDQAAISSVMTAFGTVGIAKKKKKQELFVIRTRQAADRIRLASGFPV